MMIPASLLISVFLFGIEELATQLEEPFTILPMQGFCDKIGANCDEIVSWAGQDVYKIPDEVIEQMEMERPELEMKTNLALLGGEVEEDVVEEPKKKRKILKKLLRIGEGIRAFPTQEADAYLLTYYSKISKTLARARDCSTRGSGTCSSAQRQQRRCLKYLADASITSQIRILSFTRQQRRKQMVPTRHLSGQGASHEFVILEKEYLLNNLKI
eukprot:scaffold6963_cov98-Skeletonema_marinoi.AAC.2